MSDNLDVPSSSEVRDNLRSRLSELEAKLAEAGKKNRLWHMAAEMLAAGEGYYSQYQPDTGTYDGQKPRFVLNMNDVFAWACVDDEDVPESAIEEVYNLWRSGDKTALIKWASARRNQEPQEPIKKWIKQEERIQELEAKLAQSGAARVEAEAKRDEYLKDFQTAAHKQHGDFIRARALEKKLSDQTHFSCRHIVGKPWTGPCPICAELTEPVNAWYLPEQVLEIAKQDHDKAVLFLNEERRMREQAETALSEARAKLANLNNAYSGYIADATKNAEKDRSQMAALTEERDEAKASEARVVAALKKRANATGHFCSGTTGHTPDCMDAIVALSSHAPAWLDQKLAEAYQSGKLGGITEARR